MAAVNGSFADVQKPDVEQGTAFDRYERIFNTYEDGRIFIPDRLTVRKLDQMLEVDGKARAIEQVLTLPLRGASWSLEATDGDSGERDFVYEALTRAANAGGMSTPFELVIAQAVSACLYRRSFFEKVFAFKDGRLVYDKLAFRPPATCELRYNEKSGAFEGFRQYVGDDHPGADEEGKVWIRPEKAFVFVYGQHRKPVAGISDLDAVHALFEAKQKVRFLWFSFLENQVIPKGIAKHSNDDPAEIQKFAQKVATLKSGGVVGIGPNQSLDPFETTGSAAQAFSDAIRFLDSEMSGSVLAGFTDLASAAAAGRGSLALSADQSAFFMQSRQAVLTELAACIASWLVADLVRWNFGIGASPPTFKFGPLLKENVEQAITLLTALASSQQPSVLPREFIDLLTVKVADYLNIDADQVRKSIEKAQAQAPQSPVDQLKAGVDAAAQLVAHVQQQTAAVPA